MYPVSICCIEREGDAIYARRPATRKLWRISEAVAHFLMCLDGKTDPYQIPDCPFSPEQIFRLLKRLEEASLLMPRRVSLSLFSSRIALYIAPKRFSVRVRRACLAAALTLAVLWAPVLVLGLYSFIHGDFAFGGNMMLGIALGLLVGMVLHECAHAVSCVGLGGRLFDGGVMTMLVVLPAAFVEIDFERLGRAARVQTLLAGVQANFLLAGIGFFLEQWWCGDFWLAVGSVNLLMGFLNIGIFYFGLDGAKALSELLGVDLMLSMDLLTNRRAQQTLRQETPHAGVRIAAAKGMVLLQAGVLVLIALDILEVILWIF